MTSAWGHRVIEAGRSQAGMTLEDLWMDYFALGGAETAGELRAYLAGARSEAMDYDVLAQALNERFVDQAGGYPPVPYADDLD